MTWGLVAAALLVGPFVLLAVWAAVQQIRQRDRSTSAVPAKLRFYLRPPWTFEAELEKKGFPGPFGPVRLTVLDHRPWVARSQAERYRAARAAEQEAKETGP